MFDWVDHTAELELHVEAATEAGVLVEATRALRELLEDEGLEPEPATPAGDDRPMVREVELEAPDRAGLLVDWLEELVFLAETEGLVPESVDDLEVSQTRLRAVVRGRRGAPRHLVKAVTYHGLSFEPAHGRWRATVVFDV